MIMIAGIGRTILLIILVFFIVRLVSTLSLIWSGRRSRKGASSRQGDIKGGRRTHRKGVPRDIGEYVDYEEVDDDDEK